MKGVGAGPRFAFLVSDHRTHSLRSYGSVAVSRIGDRHQQAMEKNANTTVEQEPTVSTSSAESPNATLCLMSASGSPTRPI